MKRLAVKISALLEGYSYGLFLLALLVVAVFSLMPKGSPGDPGATGLNDDLIHILAYGAVIFIRAVTPLVPLFWTSIVVLAWGSLIEWLQLFVGRSGALADMMANDAGVLAGLAVGYAIRRVIMSLSR